MTPDSFPYQSDQVVVEVEVVRMDDTSRPSAWEEPPFRGILHTIATPQMSQDVPPSEVYLNDVYMPSSEYAIFLLDQKLFFINETLRPNQVVKFVWEREDQRFERSVLVTETSRYLSWRSVNEV